MDRFDEQAAKFDRLLLEKKTEEAMELALVACTHFCENNPVPESPNLRDARSDLLAKCAFALPSGHEYFPSIQCLLQRRIFNCLNGGRNHEEAILFPTLLPYGTGSFDTGYDRPAPLALEEYIDVIRSRGEDRGSLERLRWLRGKSKEVITEMHQRMMAVHGNEPLRVGARVVAHGLKNETYNGLKGTVTRKQGERRGVYFDGHGDTPKALKPSNLDPILPINCCCLQCVQEPSDLEQAMSSLICAAQSLDSTHDPSVRARLDLAWKFLGAGRVTHPKCAASACLGSGCVDIVSLHCPPDVSDHLKKCRGYFLTGLSADCQA